MFMVMFAYNIYGYVLSEKGEPLQAAAVILFNDKGSKVGGSYTDKEGFFKILNVKPGRYYVKVSYLGYEEKKIEGVEVRDGDINLGKVYLKPKAVRVKAIEVEAEPPKITFEGEKKVIRFGEEISSRGKTALEALKNVPGVRVDNNDNIIIENTSKITLLVNGKPTVFEPSDFLRQIPASSVERVEIITNPSAKYEAQGSVIMNIILKEEKRKGFSASMMGRYGTYNNFGINTSSAINKERFKFMLSGRYFGFKNHMDISNDVKTSDFNYSPVGERYFYAKPIAVENSVEYRISPRSTLTFEGEIGRWGFDMGWLSEYQTFRSEMLARLGSVFGSLSTEYYGNFQNLGEIKLLSSYSYSNFSENTQSLTKDNSGNIYDGFRRTSYGPHHRGRVKLDYTRDLKGIKIESGYQGDVWFQDNSLQFFRYANGFTPDGSYTYKYNTLNNAGYFVVSSKNARINYQLGIRVEYYTNTISTDTSNYRGIYGNLFPSAHISYNLNMLNHIKASYSRRVWYPMSWMLNPFVRKIDNYSYQKGNPYLEPEYTHSFEVGYQRILSLGSVSLEGFYKRTDNEAEFYPYYDRSLGSLVYTWQNGGVATSSGLEVGIDLKPLRFLSSYISVDIYDYRVYYRSKYSRSFSYDLKGSLNIGYGPWGVQISANYQSPRVSSVGNISESYYFDIGLRVPLSRNLFFIAQFDDFLRTKKETRTIEDNGLKMTYEVSPKWPYITVMLMFDYNSFYEHRKKKEENGFGEEVPMF